jgi:hypothetical protein
VFNYSLDSGAWSGETTATSYTASAGLANGSHNVQVEERDAAGNWSGASTSSVNINASPNAPSVTGTSPTVDTTPTWSWTTGGFGNGNFQYQLDSSETWTATTGTGYTPAALANGPHTLDVQETDANGNWSTSGSRTVAIYDALPFPNERGVSTKPVFSWQPILILGSVTYSVQLSTDKLTWTTVATGVSSPYTYPSTLALSKTYYWRLVRTKYYTLSKTTVTDYLPSATCSAGSPFVTTSRLILL